MGIFSTSGAKSNVQGLSVHINDGAQTPEQRLQRANGRVEALTKKLLQLDRRRQHFSDRVINKEIEKTKFAINEWRKRVKIADFEIKVTRGEV
jgi:hypothetical protein